MLKKYDDKIGFREFFAIIVFCIAIRVSDTTPVLLVKAGLNASWVIPIISELIFIFPLLCLLSLLKLYRSKNLLDIIYHVTGKYIGFILTFLLFLIIMEYLVITSRGYSDIMGSMFYLKTPTYFLLIIFIACSWFAASKGINLIGSLCWFTYPLLKAICIVVILLV